MWQWFKNLFKKKKEAKEPEHHYLVIFDENDKIEGLTLNQENYSYLLADQNQILYKDSKYFNSHLVVGNVAVVDAASITEIGNRSVDTPSIRVWVEVKSREDMFVLLQEIRRKKEQEMQQIKYKEKNDRVQDNFEEGVVVKLKPKAENDQIEFLGVVYHYFNGETHFKIAPIGVGSQFYKIQDNITGLDSKTLKGLYGVVKYYYDIEIPPVVNIDVEF